MGPSRSWREQPLAPLLDEIAQRAERDAAGLGLQVLGDDQRQRDLGLVLLGRVVDDLHLFAGADHLADLQERDVAAVLRVVELPVRVALDDAPRLLRRRRSLHHRLHLRRLDHRTPPSAQAPLPAIQKRPNGLDPGRRATRVAMGRTDAGGDRPRGGVGRLRGGRRSARTSPSRSNAASSAPCSGPTGPGSRPWCSCSRRGASPAGRPRSAGRTSARSTGAPIARRVAVVPQPVEVALGLLGARGGRHGPRAAPGGVDAAVGGGPGGRRAGDRGLRALRRSPAGRSPSCPAASRSGSPSRGPSRRRRPCSCSTRRGRTSTCATRSTVHELVRRELDAARSRVRRRAPRPQRRRALRGPGGAAQGGADRGRGHRRRR